MLTAESIKTIALGLGADQCGIASVEWKNRSILPSYADLNRPPQSINNQCSVTVNLDRQTLVKVNGLSSITALYNYINNFHVGIFN